MKKQRNILIFVTLALLLALVLTIVFKNKTMRLELLEKESIPNMEIMNHIVFESGRASGSLTGFVAFEKSENQPRDLKQYRKITPTSQINNEGNQIYIVEDIIDMEYIAPKSVGEEFLTVITEDHSAIALSDKAGNIITIGKEGQGVLMKDIEGTTSHLITDEGEFRDFIFGRIK